MNVASSSSISAVQTDLTHDGPLGLRATIALAPIGLAQFDAQGRFLLVNDRLCEILHCPRKELLTRTFQDLTFPDDLAHCLELTAMLAANEIPNYCVEKRFVRPDGSAVWTRITVSAARTRDGQVAFFIGAAEDITAQVMATRALKSTEERLRAALDASMIGTFRFDVRHNTLEWADGLERVFGTGQNVTLEQFFDVIHPDDRAHVLESYTRSVTQGSDFEEEFRVIWPDGSIHWLHDRGRMFLGLDGMPQYILGAITDISNHKRMEDVIRERDAQFRTLANSIPQLTWIANKDGTRTWYNERWYDYTGYGRDHMQGLGWLRVHHPHAADAVLAAQRKAFETGGLWEDTVRLRGKDGKYRWFLSRAVPVRTALGTTTQWFGTNTDITDRLADEEKLREREVRYRRALDVENIGVIFFDNSHRVTGINQAFARMSGYTSDDVSDGMILWRDLTPAQDIQLAELRQVEYDATGRTTPSEQEFTRKDGTHWWGLVTATRVGDAEGVKFVLDITARKDAEREREEILKREQEARQEAERAIALRQQVLAFVAHDLRNPVHTIVASSSLLEMPIREDQRTQQIELIKRCAWGMERLIGDLLDLSRIEAGTFAVRFEPVSIAAVLSEVVENFRDRAQSRGITLEAEAAADTPHVDGDQQRIVQALSNLVGNAIRFTPTGGRILLSASHSENSVDIIVRDTGSGIVPENLPLIFDRFWQANRASGGAGLGLAIVKGIVESHRGEISVASTLGQGTTFCVRLPRAD